MLSIKFRKSKLRTKFINCSQVFSLSPFMFYLLDSTLIGGRIILTIVALRFCIISLTLYLRPLSQRIRFILFKYYKTPFIVSIYLYCFIPNNISRTNTVFYFVSYILLFPLHKYHLISRGFNTFKRFIKICSISRLFLINRITY